MAGRGAAWALAAAAALLAAGAADRDAEAQWSGPAPYIADVLSGWADPTTYYYLDGDAARFRPAISDAFGSWAELNPGLGFAEAGSRAGADVLVVFGRDLSEYGHGGWALSYEPGRPDAIYVEYGGRDCNGGFASYSRATVTDLVMEGIGYMLGLGNTLDGESIMYGPGAASHDADTGGYVLPERYSGDHHYYEGEEALREAYERHLAGGPPGPGHARAEEAYGALECLPGTYLPLGPEEDPSEKRSWTYHVDPASARFAPVIEAAFAEWAGLNPGLVFERTQARGAADVEIFFQTDLMRHGADASAYVGYYQPWHNAADQIFVDYGDTDCTGELVGYTEEALADTMMHEIGHLLGIGHTTREDSLMYGDDAASWRLDTRGYEVPGHHGGHAQYEGEGELRDEYGSLQAMYDELLPEHERLWDEFYASKAKYRNLVDLNNYLVEEDNDDSLYGRAGMAEREHFEIINALNSVDAEMGRLADGMKRLSGALDCLPRVGGVTGEPEKASWKYRIDPDSPEWIPAVNDAFGTWAGMAPGLEFERVYSAGEADIEVLLERDLSGLGAGDPAVVHVPGDPGRIYVDHGDMNCRGEFVDATGETVARMVVKGIGQALGLASDADGGVDYVYEGEEAMRDKRDGYPAVMPQNEFRQYERIAEAIECLPSRTG